MPIRAILLLSGGLDSTLVAKIMLNQGIELIALNLVTPFCTCTRKGCQSEAKKVAQTMNIPLRIVSGGMDYIKMIQSPRFGYGKNMNPCVDCRIFIFSHAKSLMLETDSQFVVTGDVLGERPMSQRRQAMDTIERESGLEGLVLRPLSAKLLSPTIPEKERWVDRANLLSISGRCRKPQIALASELGIDAYPCPAGGCRLTDPNFASRFKDGLDHGEETLQEIHLLRHGRHFRLPSGAKVVVGRNELENKVIEKYFVSGDNMMTCLEPTRGPTTLLKKAKGEEDIDLACQLTWRYGDGHTERGHIQITTWGNTTPNCREVSLIDEQLFEQYRI